MYLEIRSTHNLQIGAYFGVGGLPISMRNTSNFPVFSTSLESVHGFYSAILSTHEVDQTSVTR
jgi:hypothetical protein